MATIREQLNKLKSIKSSIKTALVKKGAEIYNSTPFEDYVIAINKLSSSSDAYIFEQMLDEIRGSLSRHPYGVGINTPFLEIPAIMDNYIDRDGLNTHARGFNQIKENVIQGDNIESVSISDRFIKLPGIDNIIAY